MHLPFALLLLLLSLAACESDAVVDPSTTGDDTADTADTTTTDPPTGGGPFPDPTSEPTTTVDPTDDPPPQCAAVEPVSEPDFPGKMATRVCQQRTACGCASATCTVDVAAALSDMATWSKGQALTYDPDCAAALYARADAVACDDQVTAASQGCASCNIYRGPRTAAQACDTNPYALYASQCAADLACAPSSMQCALAVLPEAALGQLCFSGGAAVARCSAGSLCDSGGSGTCVQAPAAGEPCFGLFACEAGMWCDDNVRCQPQKATGEPCTGLLECRSLECKAGACASTPWICRPPWSAGA